MTTVPVVVDEPSPPSPPGPLSDTDALPVRLVLTGPAAAAVRRWVESVIGWQSVEAGTDGLPPAVRLLDVPAASAADPVLGPGPAPTVLLVTDGDDPQAAAAAACQADLVLAWPGERDELPTRIADLLPRAPAASGLLRVTVGGAGGGVGTSTVANGLAGLGAWKGRRTLVVETDPGGDDEVARAIAEGAPGWEAGEPVRGLRRMRSLRLPAGAADPDAGSAQLVVHDLGVSLDVDVLVCRRDHRALRALPHTTASVVAITDAGPASARDLRRAAAGRRITVLPWSARVARAGLRDRVPAGLPGAWVRRLAPILAGEA